MGQMGGGTRILIEHNALGGDRWRHFVDTVRTINGPLVWKTSNYRIISIKWTAQIINPSRDIPIGLLYTLTCNQKV